MTCTDLRDNIFAREKDFRLIREDVLDHLASCDDCRTWFRLEHQRKQAQYDKQLEICKLHETFRINDPGTS